MTPPPKLKRIRTSELEIAYEESGPMDGTPVVLLHGFPYAPRADDAVVPPLVAANYRTIVPYLRGYGPTSFLSSDTMRSGQQAALGQDLWELLNALSLPSATLVGYDWGGRAACIVAALWPERVSGLLSVGGYNIQDIAAAVAPLPPQQEHRLWYQYYFHAARGRAGLESNRHELCRLLWQQWSPRWKFEDSTYQQTAVTFDNPDFVEVVIHSYRHRCGYAAGAPVLEEMENRLAVRPGITVPTIVLHGGDDGVNPAQESEGHTHFFSQRYQRTVIPGVGHNLPQEAPEAIVDAIFELTA